MKIEPLQEYKAKQFHHGNLYYGDTTDTTCNITFDSGATYTTAGSILTTNTDE